MYVCMHVCIYNTCILMYMLRFSTLRVHSGASRAIAYSPRLTLQTTLVKPIEFIKHYSFQKPPCFFISSLWLHLLQCFSLTLMRHRGRCCVNTKHPQALSVVAPHDTDTFS